MQQQFFYNYFVHRIMGVPCLRGFFFIHEYGLAFTLCNLIYKLICFNRLKQGKLIFGIDSHDMSGGIVALVAGE